jgi:hypothetical protein
VRDSQVDPGQAAEVERQAEQEVGVFGLGPVDRPGISVSRPTSRSFAPEGTMTHRRRPISVKLWIQSAFHEAASAQASDSVRWGIMNRPLIPFGILFLVVGLGVGYLMYAHPEGLNPDWPLGMAMLVPAVFAAGGLHLTFRGLGYPRLSIAMLRVILLCLGAIVHWAAFFSSRVQCSETLSFLGTEVLSRYPSETECRNHLRVIIACLDALVLLTVCAFGWWKLQGSRSKPPG